MIRILIVDDHAVVRQGVKKILSDEADMAVVGEARNADELMAIIGTKKWDVLILDVSMPGKNGLDVLKDVRQKYPKIPVLFLSMLPEEQFAVRALKAGAAGYVTKESAPDELVNAVRKVYSGRKYVSPSLAENIATSLDVETTKFPHERLSEREFQVFVKIASGKTLTDIAGQLYLSTKTVTTYRQRVLAKMNMRSNAELVRYALEHKLIE